MASVLSAGTTSNTALNLSADTTGILQFQTNGTTAAMTLDTSQNVGIGLTNPSAILHISSASQPYLKILYAAQREYALTVTGSTTSDGLAIRDESGSAEIARFCRSGNVGIGTSSPVGRLNVYGASGGRYLTLDAPTNGGYATFQAGGTAFADIGSQLAINATGNATDFLITSRSYPLLFGTSSTERMRITSGGDVGIGTTSPTHKLQVNGAGRFGSQTTGPGLLDGSSDNFRVGLNQDNTNTSNTQIWAEYTTGASVASWAVRYRAANDTGTAATRMLINTSGDVGIGSISPSSRLHVDGGSGMSSSGVIARFFGTSGNSLLIRGNGNAENTNGSYGAISDAKLKENIVDATPKLDKVIQLKVRNYNLIGDNLKQIGFVAQEIEQVFPSIVSEIPDLNEEGNDLGTTTKTVKTSVLIPILVKAIQELKAELDATKAEVAALKGVN